jgi:hypothetical protein
VGSAYVAISRLPWLTALAAWGTCGTWSQGYHFVEDRDVWQVGTPELGDVRRCRDKFGMAVTRPASFAVERRRGWTETPDSPLRSPDDMWDQRRGDAVALEKARPESHGATRLTVRGVLAAFRGNPEWGRTIRYEITGDGEGLHLEDAHWADWAADGRLLVATVDGKLQVRDYTRGGTSVRSEVDLRALTPAPAPPPKEAHQW